MTNGHSAASGMWHLITTAGWMTTDFAPSAAPSLPSAAGPSTAPPKSVVTPMKETVSREKYDKLKAHAERQEREQKEKTARIQKELDRVRQIPPPRDGGSRTVRWDDHRDARDRSRDRRD